MRVCVSIERTSVPSSGPVRSIVGSLFNTVCCWFCTPSSVGLMLLSFIKRLQGDLVDQCCCCVSTFNTHPALRLQFCLQHQSHGSWELEQADRVTGGELNPLESVLTVWRLIGRREGSIMKLISSTVASCSRQCAYRTLLHRNTVPWTLTSCGLNAEDCGSQRRCEDILIFTVFHVRLLNQNSVWTLEHGVIFWLMRKESEVEIKISPVFTRLSQYIKLTGFRV